MMRLELRGTERAALVAAAVQERRVRAWRRYQALLRLAAGERPEAVAAALGCARSSVFAWAASWRREGLAGVEEPPHRGGQPRRLAGEGEALLAELLAGDPQARGQHATGWTVPRLRAELATAGYAVGERTIRRALHRAGWRWKRPKYVLGRPDPQYAGKGRRSWSRRGRS
jgi:transposase